MVLMEVNTELGDIWKLVQTDVTVAGVGLARPVFPSVISLWWWQWCHSITGLAGGSHTITPTPARCRGVNPHCRGWKALLAGASLIVGRSITRRGDETSIYLSQLHGRLVWASEMVDIDQSCQSGPRRTGGRFVTHWFTQQSIFVKYQRARAATRNAPHRTAERKCKSNLNLNGDDRKILDSWARAGKAVLCWVSMSYLLSCAARLLPFITKTLQPALLDIMQILHSAWEFAQLINSDTRMETQKM